MWWMVMVALAEESGTKLAPDYGRWDAQLESTLSQEGWYGARAKLDGADLAALVRTLESLDETALPPKKSALAWKARLDEFEVHVGSNLRVARNADGEVAALAFGVTRTEDGGRMLSKRNQDVLVVYDAGVPSHIYRVSNNHSFFSTWNKTLWTLTRNEEGALVGALEVVASHRFHSDGKPGLGSLSTKHSRRQITL